MEIQRGGWEPCDRIRKKGTAGGDGVAQSSELLSLFAPVAATLDRVEGSLQEALQGQDPEIQTILTHLPNAGGKRIRPALVLMGAWSGRGPDQTAIDVAVAAELIHMATLIHDDVIDQAPVRRGRPTVDRLWSTQIAVLAGDSLFARAFTTLAQTKIPSLTECMSRAVTAMSDGEIRQNLDARSRRFPSEEEYFQRIAAKTAVFIAECVRAGGIAGGVPDGRLSDLYQFGYHAGLAYQVVDDLLDFEVSKEVAGKATAADLEAGVVTLPVIRALAALKAGSHMGLSRKEADTLQENLLGVVRGEIPVSAIRPILESTGALKTAHETARILLDQAMADTERLGPRVREQFGQVAAFLAQRTA